MQYESFSLPNGLRIIHLPADSPVSYCGFTVNAGTRDEQSNQQGLAHFVEHTLFKGTRKRKSWHILNRMENVGGELNAYTTKEETVLYSVCLSDDIERAIELLSDLICNSQFPEKEIEKERDVVIDEINSYEDTPSDLIFDEFENILFSGNELGHNILVNPTSVESFVSDSCRSFLNDFYRPDNMIFFSYGKTPFNKIVRLANKYFLQYKNNQKTSLNRTVPCLNPARSVEIDKGLHQLHALVGGRGYGYSDPKRIGLYLLNNLLGGPGMNSRLNVSLREKYGLVYTVESLLTSYTDSGNFTIYFGCDHESKNQCLKLINKELKRLRDNKLSDSQLAAAVKQWKGQLGIATDNKESLALGMGKSFLHLNRYDSLENLFQKIDALTASQILEIANEVFDEKNLFGLIFR